MSLPKYNFSNEYLPWKVCAMGRMSRDVCESACIFHSTKCPSETV